MFSFLDKIIDINSDKYDGLTKEVNTLIIVRKFLSSNKDVIVLTGDLLKANNLYGEISTYIDDVYLFPMDDFVSSVALSISPELKIKRLETLRKIADKTPKIIITNLMGYIHLLPNKKTVNEKFIINLGLEISREKIVEKLEIYGYTRTSLVTTTGEYAVRGFIVDYFAIDDDQPVRIEFFGDTIESIRYFDDTTQLSTENIDTHYIYPFKEIISEESTSLTQLLNDPLIIKIDPNQIKLTYDKLLEEKQHYIDNNKINPEEKLFNNYNEKEKAIEIDTINKSPNNKIICQEIPNFNSDINQFNQFVIEKINDNKTIIICLATFSQIEFMKSKLSNAIVIDNFNDIKKNKINIINIKLNKGFIINNYVVVSDKDYEKISFERIKYKSSLKIGKRISNFDQIIIGDYVVHRIHGIGIYNGIVTIEKNKISMDYIQILYKGNDKVYIPIEKINTLYKYTSKDGNKPTINKLNSIEWENKKRKVQAKINDISKELIELYAERESQKGEPLINYVEEATFASEFIYDPTPDQIKAIEEIDKDLQLSRPMDRLLCGDVGYGKTEVAFRTIFKTVMNGYQVAYLCPTTILSNQQYQSAVERFKNYPINIALLNRFVTEKETKNILLGLEKGTIDIVIGTHKLLNEKIKYKNLNLLVIDEEQRFGVIHKEKIKKIKKNVNVLTLSATPIPRTLKMALSGIRDLSIIDTPPINRYPVQTYVIEEDELLIKDAIYKEISRDGQCFILYNRVANIEEKAFNITKLVPDARVIAAHGQMNKQELENIMTDFINEKYNVLVCTTIIESGIDIPNVNTLIVIDADQFGLSQLYQIRGRVGRSDRIAYAYLMYKKNKILTDVAIKRLKSIQEFTELGSGYKIAMRDLAIRGAGDVLGSEQAGFVDSVGIELYMEMINEKIAELNNQEIKKTEDDIQNLVDVETHIPNTYVSDEMVKIEIHKMINEIDSKEKLEAVKEVIEDRFGKITDNIKVYMHQRLFEYYANKNNINQINFNKTIIELTVPRNLSNEIDGEKLLQLITKINSSISLTYRNGRITIIIYKNKLKRHFIYYLLDIMNIIETKKAIKGAD